jgi:hypothetical protein
MNALTHLHYREQRLCKARDEIRAVYRAGGMSDRELFDMVNFLIAQCSPEQQEAKEQLLTIASDLDLDEPDADAFRRYPGSATLDSRLERV